MIKQDWADGRVFAQIVLVRGIVSVPSDHIERRMIEIRRPQRAAPFNKHSGRSVSILVRRYRSEEVAWIGETVGSDRPAFRQGEGASIVLAKISARRARRQLDPHFNAARDHRNLARLDVDNTELGPEAQITLLRHDQHLTIGVVEVLVLHGSRNEIEMGAHARLGAGISCRRHGANALDKGKTLIRDWDGIPTPSRFRKFENQKCLRPLLREDDRENNSAHSWLVHVFTQPGSSTDFTSLKCDVRWSPESRRGSVPQGQANWVNSSPLVQVGVSD